MRCVNLEPLIQSEVSQKRTTIYINIYINIWNLEKFSDRSLWEWTYGQSRGRWEWDRWGSCIDIYTITCKIGSGKLLHNIGSQPSALWWLKRVDGGRRERLQEGRIIYNYDWFDLSYSRNQQKIVKQFFTIEITATSYMFINRGLVKKLWYFHEMQDDFKKMDLYVLSPTYTSKRKEA